ncbi:GNAT family N-acetyltransferase [Cryptosporangium phraense]|uniref:GNAT family N-acetyltransferase n=1 Tax=Cryptosporangium phraense TaxID=2593070 RepID=UPI0014781AD8|nr:GNAT family N-acetyltransferase [Cryptosporangium phraense]
MGVGGGCGGGGGFAAAGGGCGGGGGFAAAGGGFAAAGGGCGGGGGFAAAGGGLAGFVSVALEPWGALERGEVDQLFVDPAFGGRGVGAGLLAAVDEVASEAGIDTLVTHASWRAAPVFVRCGYVREAVESVAIDGETLTRVRMRRSL